MKLTSSTYLLACCGLINTAYAIEMPVSTARVQNAQQYKIESTKHFDKMYYLSEVKLKQQKTNKDKAYTACVEIPKAVHDVLRFNNVNKSLFDEATRKRIEDQSSQLRAKNQDMFLNLKCQEAIDHYKFK